MRAVIFDMDGVIFDSEKAVVECWKEIAQKYEIKNIEETCRMCLGINAQVTKEIFLSEYGEHFPYDHYKKEMSALFHSRYDGGKLPVKPGIKELLTYLKENGYKTAIASSTRYRVVLQEIEDAGLLPFFDEIVGGDMVTKSKPEPEIFLHACECLGVKPKEAVVIEDSYNGIRAAHRGGMVPIMIPDMLEPNKEMEKLAAGILANPADVVSYLENRQDAERKYDTVIFDLDGTLLYTLDDLTRAVNVAMEKMKMPCCTLEQVRSYVGNGIRKLVERAVPEGTSEEKTDEAFAYFKAYYDVHCLDKTVPYDGIEELLNGLKNQGYKMAIVSNKQDAPVKELQKKFFSEYISVAIGEQEGMKRKPAPDTVFAALRELGSSPEHAVYVGDSDVDFDTANNAGLPCISVLWGFRDEAFLRKKGAVVFAKNPREVYGIVEAQILR